MQKIFLPFFIIIIIPLLPLPTPHLPACLLGGGNGTGHSVNRHTELLWCWLCFQNIFWGLIPIAGSWVFILLLFSYCTACSKTFMMVSEAAVGVKLFKEKKIKICVMLGATAFTDFVWWKGIPAPKWESVIRVIWAANIVNQLLLLMYASIFFFFFLTALFSARVFLVFFFNLCEGCESRLRSFNCIASLVTPDQN